MKTFYLTLFTFFSLCGNIAAQLLNDSFTDGNFTSSPSWNGDTIAWRVNEHLRLNTKDATVSQEVYLSTPLPNSKSAKWEFLLQMNFDPSAANRFKIYLFSDRPGLKGPLKGYYLQVGESGTEDGFDLYRQDSLSVTRIFKGPAVQRPSPDTLNCRFSIHRDSRGNWKISADPTGGRTFISYGTVRDTRHEPGGHFGLLAAYTPTRSGRFFFDELLITDPGPGPVIPPPLVEWGSLLITEVFPDPGPPAGDLPEAEFFELYNASDTVIHLAGWTWRDKHTTAGFGRDSIAPGEYLIICEEENLEAFSVYGHAAGLSPFPSLNNTGDRLQLSAPQGKLIDTLSYSDQWYRDPLKEKGGFTLERIAFSLPCFQEANWGASVSPAGGTPGAASSLSDSISSSHFAFVDMIIQDSLTLEVNFNTFPEPVSALRASNYRMNNGAVVKTIQFTEDRQGVVLFLEETLRRGSLYRLTMTGLHDCYGNQLEISEKEFLLPQLAEPGDVIINEILFNPRPGGADFVEIYNRSDKILDLKDFGLASHPRNDSLNKVIPVTAGTRLIYPGQYCLLSKYPERVKAQHFTKAPETFLSMDRFPAYNNENGSCVLISRGRPIDRFDYRENMHFQLLREPEGISLEKVHFDPPAARPGIFRSAAATAGYATPGYRNSQFIQAGSLSAVKLSNSLFTPDNDGRNDRLLVSYRFPRPNSVASIRIFNANGFLIRHLAGNLLLGTEGTLAWDGSGDSGTPLKSGPYLVIMEVFSENGQVERFKKFCVLARRE